MRSPRHCAIGFGAALVVCAMSATARAQDASVRSADAGVAAPQSANEHPAGPHSADDGVTPQSADVATPQNADSDTAAVAALPESSSWSAVPLVSYARETEFAFGGFGVVYFRLGDSAPTSRPSFVAADAMVTTRGQILADIFPELWWDDEHWVVTGQVAYRRFPDYFFGVGNDTREEDRESYTLHSVWTRFDLRYRAWKSLFVGARHQAQWHELLELDDAPLLSSGNVRGAEGGFRQALGPLLIWDSRDSTLSARSGLYYELSFLVSGSFLGSDYDYARFTLDANHYVSITDTQTLAVEVFVDAMAGDVPFNQLAQLGGVFRMRGFYEGQYRDKTYVMTQVEYRFMPLFWRIGGVLFAGLGEVAERWRDFSFDGLKWAVGAGLRYALSVEERIYIRVDVGVGPDTWGLYVNVREAF